ncbi:MAG TPA: transglycosylase SLT domain-containing protein [Solirubrobacterales bacterium]
MKDPPGVLAPPTRTGSVLATDLGGASGGLAVAAAVGVALAAGDRRILLAEIGAARGRGPTTLASASARALERDLRGLGFRRAAARGRLCWLGLPEAQDSLRELAGALETARPEVSIVYVRAGLWRAALDDPALPLRGGLLRADLAEDRSLAALAVIELRERRLRVRVASRPLGLVASRRALAGLEVGGGSARRVSRLAGGLFRASPSLAAPQGQALPLTLGAAFVVLFVAMVLVALGGAATGASRVQRAADLAALSGARSLRDDFPRLFAPARLADGAPNPRHLDKDAYLARAAAVTRQAAARNGVDPAALRVSFPGRRSFAPVRVRVEVTGSVDRSALPGPRRVELRRGRRGIRVEAHAVAEAAPPAPAGLPTMASGGGYAGPLAYRQGKPMRPDVAAAFDLLAAAAARVGIALVVNSAYRSDAEQARLFAQHPDPRWVAPPGQSLHRCATELDLGPATAYAWLAAHAARFGFVKRYSWEPWHFGYARGPAPCSVAANAAGHHADGAAGATGLQDFVPARFRTPILRAAARWNVSAGLLAAQLMAESNFNPFAVSGAGAQGIAQFMPATARAYGLRNPFDAAAAIDAQAHLMSDLLRQFGSVALALAAYNAGPGAVAACLCVPQIPETRAYVARILGLMGGAGELAIQPLEVRLVA